MSDRSIPVAYIDDREVAWLQPEMFSADIYDRIVINFDGYYVLHEKDTNEPH